jgi:hypothetical protein
VVSGVVRISKLLPDGRRQISAFHAPGDMFGFEADNLHYASAEAVVPVKVIAYKWQSLLAAGTRSASLVPDLLNLTMVGLRQTQEHLLLLGRKNALERVAAFLLDMAKRTEAGSVVELAMPRHDIAMLCLLALRDEKSREFLREQNWHEILPQVPDGGILALILKSALHPDDAASLNGFMVTLSPPEERLVSSWLLQKAPPNAAAMVEKWWLGIRQAVLRRQLDVATNRIKLPNLTTGETVNLQKQILDLRGQLHELSQLAGPAGN